MIRVLAMIAVAGFLLSAVCLSVAVGIAGPEFISRGVWSWHGPLNHFRWGNDGHHGFNLGYDLSDDGPQATREIAWTGETLDVEMPAEVRFTQAEGPAKLIARGPKSALDHLVVEGGHLHFDRTMNDVGDVTIELTAPKVTHFGLSGSGKLDIADYRQDTLDLRISGDAEITAKGSAKTVKLDISGSGNANLSDLAADGADVKITGSGQTRVGPKTWAKLDISGSGDVTLIGRPARVESHVSGSGSIQQDDSGSGDDVAAPVEPPKPVKPAKAGRPV
jgi:hypothetical protein